MKLLVVGNGSIGIGKQKGFNINNHTGDFLEKISKKIDVCFLQNSTLYNKNNNLHNFDLQKHNLNFKIAPKMKSLLGLPALFLLISKYDYIYFFYPGNLSKITAIISIIIGKPFGLYVRGQYYKESVLDRFILKKAKFILTVSPSIAEDVKQFCFQTDVIKPMISISLKDFKTDRAYELKEEWRLLFVGRVEYRKGIFELLEIANILNNKGLNFFLDIVGGGDAFLEIESLIDKYNLKENIQVHGLVSDKEELTDLYNNADAFVFTSHDEGFPRVLYEAMASGLPIYTTFVGGIPGRMIDSENCFEIPVKDSIRAADIVFKSIKNIDDLESIARKAQFMLGDILDGKLLSHDELVIRALKNEK